jgi:hypothetical protein
MSATKYTNHNLSQFLRYLAADMDSASFQMAKLPDPWPVNSCKLRGQASLVREWAEQIEKDVDYGSD